MRAMVNTIYEFYFRVKGPQKNYYPRNYIPYQTNEKKKEQTALVVERVL